MNASFHPALVSSLEHVEQQIQAFAEALSGAEPAQLTQTSAQLRDAVLHLAEQAKHLEVREALAASTLQPRLAAVSSFLNLHRDNLARLAAFNERQLEVVLPQLPPEDTYGQNTANPARIYRAAG